MRPQLLVLFQRESGETTQRHVHLRVGAPRSGLRSGHVRSGSAIAGHLRRRYEPKLAASVGATFTICLFPPAEVFTYSCFCELMKRMASNFPHGGAMDTHFANMRSLIQILDVDIFELMHQNGDYTHFYFCYRWFLLDFKRGTLQFCKTFLSD